MPTGGRKTQLQVMHEISIALGPGSPVSGIVGVVPAGAILGFAHLLVSAVFNSTTNTVIFGTTPGGNQINAALDLKTLARLEGPVALAAAGPFGSDTPIYYTLASTGAAPTTGAATYWIDYLPGPG